MQYDQDQGYPIRREEPKEPTNLGTAVAKFVAKLAAGEVSQHTPSRLPAVQPREFNHHTDQQIPEILWSNWVPAIGKREIKRALTDTERTALVQRKTELAEGLRAYLPSDADNVDADLGALLGGFRSMRHEGIDVEAVLAVLRHVLRDFPLWAISEGCRRIVMNEAGLDPRWPPNDAQIHAVVKAVVRPYQIKLIAVTDLLTARIENQSIPEEDLPKETWEETKADLARRGFSFGEKPKPTENAWDVRNKYGISQAAWDAIPNLPADFEAKAKR